MTDAKNMRGYLKLFEAAAPDYVGPMASDTVSYEAEQTNGMITKIVAYLKSYDSARYTRLGNNLVRINELTEEIKTLQAETKQEVRDLIGGVFHSWDAVSTRIVDTVSFVFHLSKDPKPTSSISYAKVLTELEQHMTPELLKICEEIKAKHTSAPVQKAASLTVTDKRVPVKTEESIGGNLAEKLKIFFNKFYQEVKAWGVSYDSRLDELKAETGSLEEAVIDNSKLEDHEEAERYVINMTISLDFEQENEGVHEEVYDQFHADDEYSDNQGHHITWHFEEREQADAMFQRLKAMEKDHPYDITLTIEAEEKRGQSRKNDKWIDIQFITRKKDFRNKWQDSQDWFAFVKTNIYPHFDVKGGSIESGQGTMIEFSTQDADEAEEFVDYIKKHDIIPGIDKITVTRRDGKKLRVDGPSKYGENKKEDPCYIVMYFSFPESQDWEVRKALDDKILHATGIDSDTIGKPGHYQDLAYDGAKSGRIVRLKYKSDLPTAMDELAHWQDSFSGLIHFAPYQFDGKTWTPINAGEQGSNLDNVELPSWLKGKPKP